VMSARVVCAYLTCGAEGEVDGLGDYSQEQHNSKDTIRMMMKTAVAVALAMFASVASAQEWPAPLQPQELVTHMLARPCRVLDTRLPGCQAAVLWPRSLGTCQQGKLSDGETRYMNFQTGPAQCNGVRPIPLNARGLIVTIAVVEPTGNGHLVIYDPYPLTGEVGAPLAATLNFTAGQNSSTLAFTALGQFQLQSISIPFAPDSAMTIRVAGPGKAHVVLDVVGYLQQVAP
jgi:hypothetical protein